MPRGQQNRQEGEGREAPACGRGRLCLGPDVTGEQRVQGTEAWGPNHQHRIQVLLIAGWMNLDT